MIKIVVLEERVYTQRIPRDVWYSVRRVFKKYIAENGNAVCAIDGEIVEPNAGNEVYRKLKAKGAKCVEREVLDMSDEEIIEYLDSGIDKYSMYIDNGRQWEEAEMRNYKLRKLIKEFERIC